MSIDSFRTANNADAETIAELVNRAYRPESGATGWTHESDLVAGNRTNAAQIVGTILSRDSVILVGLNNEEIVACAHVQKDGNCSHIGMLAVNPILQKVGAGKQMLAHAEKYASAVFGSEKFVMVVVSARIELVSFYLRRGYHKTGSVMGYPLSAGAGTPKTPDLKIEVLEKRSNIAVKRDAPKTARPLP